MSVENSAVMRRWFEEVWNQRRAEVIDELLAADSVCCGDGGSLTGPREFCDRQYRPMVSAFPDLRVVVDDMLADGDRVAIRWTATGTHTGDGLGFAPTGRAVTFRGLTWVHVSGGRLREGWQESNIPALLRELAPPA